MNYAYNKIKHFQSFLTNPVNPRLRHKVKPIPTLDNETKYILTNKFNQIQSTFDSIINQNNRSNFFLHFGYVLYKLTEQLELEIQQRNEITKQSNLVLNQYLISDITNIIINYSLESDATYKEIRQSIPLLKSKQKLAEHDRYWKKIYDNLG